MSILKNNLKIMAFQAGDLNQDTLSKLEAEQKFPQVQEKKVQQVKIAKDTIQWQIALALEMAKKDQIPVIDLSKIPKLAWPVPVWYFDEVKENYWDETAKKYQEFASYFTDLVVKEEQETISEDLLAVFNNPWDSEAWWFFIEDLEEFSNWKKVSQVKLDELKELTDKMWVALNQDLKKLDLAIAKQSEMIKRKEEQIKEAKAKIAELRKERAEIGKERAEIRNKKMKLEKKIKELEKLIKQRWDDLDKLKTKFG